jgi:hypothetical protein
MYLQCIESEGDGRHGKVQASVRVQWRSVSPYLLLCAGRGVAAVLVTSKKKAMVVPGSTPPRNQELVPLRGEERREAR